MTLRELFGMLTAIASEETLNKEVILDGNASLVGIRNRKNAIILSSFYPSDVEVADANHNRTS